MTQLRDLYSITFIAKNNKNRRKYITQRQPPPPAFRSISKLPQPAHQPISAPPPLVCPCPIPGTAAAAACPPPLVCVPVPTIPPCVLCVVLPPPPPPPPADGANPFTRLAMEPMAPVMLEMSPPMPEIPLVMALRSGIWGVGWGRARVRGRRTAKMVVGRMVVWWGKGVVGLVGFGGVG